MTEPSRIRNCLLADNSVLMADRFVLEDNDFIGSGGLKPPNWIPKKYNRR